MSFSDQGIYLPEKPNLPHLSSAGRSIADAWAIRTFVRELYHLGHASCTKALIRQLIDIPEFMVDKTLNEEELGKSRPFDNDQTRQDYEDRLKYIMYEISRIQTAGEQSDQSSYEPEQSER